MREHLRNMKYIASILTFLWNKILSDEGASHEIIIFSTVFPFLVSDYSRHYLLLFVNTESLKYIISRNRMQRINQITRSFARPFSHYTYINSLVCSFMQDAHRVCESGVAQQRIHYQDRVLADYNGLSRLSSTLNASLCHLVNNRTEVREVKERSGPSRFPTSGSRTSNATRKSVKQIQ